MDILMNDVASVAGTDAPTLPGQPLTAPGSGVAFAAQLGEALDRLQGQTFADGVPGLQATALSPGLQVLTPSNVSMDHQSLADFAKAQGIDEAAVRWLFQTPAASGADVPVGAGDAQAAAGALFTGTPLGPDGASAPVVGVDGAGLTSIRLATPMETAQAPMSAVAMLMRRAEFGEGRGQTPSTGVPTLTAVAPIAPPAVLVPADAAQAPADGEVTEAGDDADGEASDALQATWMALGLWRTDPNAATAGRGLSPEAASVSTDPIQGLPQATMPLRDGLVAALQKAATTATAERKNATVVEELELDPELQADLSAWLDDGSIEPPAEVAPPAHNGPASAAAGQSASAPITAARSEAVHQAAQASTAAERAENLQALANRVGQALGQRMVSMIERGHWNVRFMLKPQQLGEIEVDLRMRAGELDAAFRATHAFTRELLQDGLPKLREVMSSMGMDVASMHVGNGQTSKHGGNSTPQRPRPTPGQQAGESTATTAVNAAPSRTSRQGSDGLDVMV